jgi:quercetin dioxygenase-like cupin family protein
MSDQKIINIFPKGSLLSKECFSGNAFIYPLLSNDKNHEFSVGSVTFEPGARTNWHTHPKGQVQIVIEGSGYYLENGKPAQVIKKGDVVNIPEDIVHWHGAGASLQMTYVAITNFIAEEQGTRLQPVSEEEYKQAQLG